MTLRSPDIIAESTPTLVNGPSVHGSMDFKVSALCLFIKYGNETKPSILELQIVFLAAPRNDDGYGDYRARQEL